MGPSGQAGLELCYFMIAVIVALVAMTQYVRMSMAGRIKSGADGISPTLFNSSGAEVAFLRCQDSEDVRQGAAGAGFSTFGSLARDRTNLAAPVPAFALAECPEDLLP